MTSTRVLLVSACFRPPLPYAPSSDWVVYRAATIPANWPTSNPTTTRGLFSPSEEESDELKVTCKNYEMGWYRGAILLGVREDSLAPPDLPGWTILGWYADDGDRSYNLGETLPSYYGLHISPERRIENIAYAGRFHSIPFWFPAALTAFLPAVWLIRRRRSHG